jgi:hypothetical protein
MWPVKPSRAAKAAGSAATVSTMRSSSGVTASRCSTAASMAARGNLSTTVSSWATISGTVMAAFSREGEEEEKKLRAEFGAMNGCALAVKVR